MRRTVTASLQELQEWKQRTNWFNHCLSIVNCCDTVIWNGMMVSIVILLQVLYTNNHHRWYAGRVDGAREIVGVQRRGRDGWERG